MRLEPGRDPNGRGRVSDEDWASPLDRGRGFAWPRVGLVSLWVVAFALLLTGVASSWEQLVGHLAAVPRQEATR